MTLSLTKLSFDRIAFDLSGIMNCAHHEARIPLGLSRTRREPIPTRRIRPVSKAA